MNCSIFTENLSKLIEEEMEESMKYKMEEHMLQCEVCRQLYEEELFIEKAFIEALMLEDISFTSQKEKILDKIDKDKYRSYEPKKSNRKLLSYIKIITPMAAAILFIVLINPISRFKVMERTSAEKKESVGQVTSEDKSNNTTYMQKAEPGSMDDKSEKNYEISIKNEGANVLDKKDISLSNRENSVKTSQENLSKDIDSSANINSDSREKEITESGNREMAILELQDDTVSEKELDDNGDNVKDEKMNALIAENVDLMKNVDFNRQVISNKNLSKSLDKWIESPNNNLLASLAEKKYSSIETIYVENLSKNQAWSLEANLQDRNVFSRFIKWADNENLFVIIDEVRDNSIISEVVYILNVNSGNTIEIYRIIDNVKKVEDINIVNNVDIELKLSGAKNDNEDKIYMENYIISDFSIIQDR